MVLQYMDADSVMRKWHNATNTTTTTNTTAAAAADWVNTYSM